MANRVSSIQQAIPGINWRYVSTKDNPADLISRGMSPSDSSILWWNGPLWLCQPMCDWPNCPNEVADYGGEESKRCFVNNAHVLEDWGIFKLSTFKRTIRVLAYCYIFFHNSNPNNVPNVGSLLLSELTMATVYCVRVAQSQFYEKVTIW